MFLLAKKLLKTLLPERMYFLLRNTTIPSREKFLKRLPKKSIGAEIGVFKGAFSKSILEIVKPKKLYLIDGWWKICGECFPWSSRDSNFGTLKTKDAYDEARKVVKEYDKNKVSEFHIEDDLICLKKFNDRYFDWVYLDTSHKYEQTKKELEILNDKVKEKGIIMGHDWQREGVSKAVNEFCKKHSWEIIKQDNWGQWYLKKKH